MRMSVQQSYLLPLGETATGEGAVVTPVRKSPLPCPLPDWERGRLLCAYGKKTRVMRVVGTLYGIGVGPGDPDLITVKAAKILSAARIVAHFRKRGLGGPCLDHCASAYFA